MGYFKAGKGKDKEGSEFILDTKETLEDIQKYGFHACEERKIRKETCKKFGVRASVSEEDGSTLTAFYFPSYNQKGKIVGYMRQDLQKSKEEKGHWKAIGSV